MTHSISPYYTMAFVTDGGGCKPAWNGVFSSTSPDGLSQLTTLRAAGGDASLSFGGANNSELATTCSSESTLQAAYQAIITQYSLKQIDFDIEGGDASNLTAAQLRDTTLVALQKANPGLKVTFTFPVETYGISSTVIQIVQDAVAKGVSLTAVNVMAMDFGGAYDNGANMYLDMEETSWSTMQQLEQVWSGQSHAFYAGMVGLTPMIGENDDSTEVFSLANASSTVSFAENQGLGMLAFWAESRDSQCTSGETNYLCSNVSQSTGQFGTIFAAFN